MRGIPVANVPLCGGPDCIPHADADADEDEDDDDDACCQRLAAYERQIDQLHQQLAEAVQGTMTDSRTQEPAPDMQHAIDILKRSSLEVELAAKEGEVRWWCLS